MSEIPSLIADLALILATAGISTLIFKKLKQPLVLGYIMAGFIVSPNLTFTMSVIDNENIHTWADIGVMFLLFALGLDFSIKKILKMGMAPIIAALTIIFCMMSIGVMVAELLGWSHLNGLFLAGMLAMSSTTIIYKAFDDLGLRQQQFSSLVMSVLILEDILAIVLMVVLTTVAKSESASTGGEETGLMSALLSIVFFLVLWFVVGLFLVPIFLRKVRRLINEEVLLIVSLALCCAMAVFASKVGFSSAFGSFVMGSILAETIEAKKIEKLIEPVKNLFGAIFFVSVGMLVDIKVVIDQWPAIVVITLAIIFGQSIFGTFGFLLSGQPLKTAMRCGFSMSQIGEFAFIIASLGMSLGILSDFIYPVIVTVSVITTFTTPYMIRGAVPVYGIVERSLPKVWIRRINKISEMAPTNQDQSQSYWRPLLIQMAVNTLIYSVLSSATILIMLTVGKDILDGLLPSEWAGIACAVLTIMFVAPFLRAMVMKKNRSEEFRALWVGSRHNRAPLIFTIILRVILAVMFIVPVLSQITNLSNTIMLCLAIFIIVGMVYSRGIKNQSIRLERLFLMNMNSKELAERVTGKKRPLFEGRLLDRDLHIATVDVPQDSIWTGKTLKELRLAQRFGVHVSSIMRGRQKINIPSGDDIIFPYDQLNVIGSDDQLKALNSTLQEELYPEPTEFVGHDMQLRRFSITEDSFLAGKSLVTSQLRDKYNCMLVGMEENEESLTSVSPLYLFQPGDILWIVGEDQDIRRLSSQEP